MQLLKMLLAVAAVSVAHAENNPQTSPQQLLEKMGTAMELSDYQGTVVFLKNDKLEAMKYSHSFDNNGEHEKLVSLNSPPREIIRKSDEVSCLFKATKRLIVDHRPYQHSFIVDVPKNLDQLDNSYSFELAGEEDVAMTPTVIVAIQPKDELRYLRKIWVTKAHFLPVKAVIYDLSGEILEQVLFTDFQVDKASLPGNPVVSGKKSGSEMQVNNGRVQSRLEVNDLPKGFKPVFFDRKPIHQSEQAVDHLILSDGFASVSVYLETIPMDSKLTPAIPEGIHSVGAINSISRDMADSQVTVLGEVPPSTVKMIVEGIKLQPASK